MGEGFVSRGFRGQRRQKADEVARQAGRHLGLPLSGPPERVLRGRIAGRLDLGAARQYAPPMADTRTAAGFALPMPAVGALLGRPVEQAGPAPFRLPDALS